jgi:ribonuclease Z
LFDTGVVRVAAARIKHTVPCFGYVVQEHDRPGTQRANNVAELIRQNWDALEEKYGDAKKTNRFIKGLKPGDEYTFPDGTVVGYDDVMEEPHRGRKVVILGDTSDPRNVSALAQGADVLVHEATNNYIPELDEGTNAKEVEVSSCGLCCWCLT